MNIAIMSSGGDCAGSNPAIKAFVEHSLNNNIRPFLIYEGLEGLIDSKIKEAKIEDVSGLSHLGGTIIRTSRSKRFFKKKYRALSFENLQAFGINKLIVLGGNGSFKAIEVFSNEFDISVVGIPSTIDNDVYKSSYSLGVDTCLNVISRALDEIRDTSSSLNRAFVIETMGRDFGYLALISAITSGAEVCIIPEIKADYESIKNRLLNEVRDGRVYTLAIVAEGSDASTKMVDLFTNDLKMDTRLLVLGYIQRGGTPSSYDRLMANLFVVKSINKLIKKDKLKKVIVYKNSKFKFLDLKEVNSHKAEINEDLLSFAKNLSK